MIRDFSAIRDPQTQLLKYADRGSLFCSLKNCGGLFFFQINMILGEAFIAETSIGHKF